jgi:glycosyltransferase involved in cell wall biosynthesis
MADAAMRIIQITPGAGTNFYCENCLRDNALVLELRRQGHDALMVPMYLPLLTEGPDATAGMPIFFGGINVYLQQKLALFRHTPRWLDRLLDARGLLKWASRRAEMTKAKDLGEATLSMLRGEHGLQVKELDRLVAWLTVQDRPDIICLSNALLAGLARRIKAALGVPVVSMLQDEDGFLDALPEPYRGEAWQLLTDRAAEIDGFLAVSRYYGGVMQRRLNLAPERVHTVHPGIVLEEFAPAPSPPAAPAIGYLAQVRRALGLDTLVEAFLAIRAGGRVPGVRLRIAGGHTPGDKPFIEEVRRRLAAAGAAGDVEWLPIPDRKTKPEFLRSLSVLAVPARGETAFGIFVLEALASGVPVVEPRAGAFPEILEATGGGILVEPDSAEALAAAIERLLANPAEARRLAEQGRRAVAAKFGIEQMTRNVMSVFESVSAKVKTG